MTVAELIERLKTCDAHETVTIIDDSGDEYEVKNVVFDSDGVIIEAECM